jgi:DNA-binding IscR family transcriptional regulator
MGGGMTLTRPPESITILEVVNAVEPIQRIRHCPLGLAAHGAHLCPLHKRLDNALAMVEEAFARSTLAEVLAEPIRSVPLCPFPNTKTRQKSPRK